MNELNNLIEDYLTDSASDDDVLLLVKECIQRMPAPQTNVLLLYAELGSYSAVARRLGVSSPTVKSYVDKIREQIRNYINDNGTDYTERYSDAHIR